MQLKNATQTKKTGKEKRDKRKVDKVSNETRRDVNIYEKLTN